jgi:hypothetical protein
MEESHPNGSIVGDDASARSGVKAGKGRLLQCVEKYEAKVRQRFKGAIKDVGLK